MQKKRKATKLSFVSTYDKGLTDRMYLCNIAKATLPQYFAHNSVEIFRARMPNMRKCYPLNMLHEVGA